MENSNNIDGISAENDKATLNSSDNLNESETDANGDVSTTEKPKFVRLPLARVKHMMKMDPDCGIISQDALFLLTKSTELFLEYLSKESIKWMGAGKRRTVQKRDVDAAIDNVPSLCFLDGALE